MSETKWTKGPWEAAYTTLPAGPFDSVVDARSRRICGMVAIGSDSEPETYCPETTVANANLIAAAPGLAAVAAWIVKHFPNQDMNHIDFRIAVNSLAEAALAKARGE